MSELQPQLAQHFTLMEQYHSDELARYEFARDLLSELVPQFPHTMAQYFDFESVWTGSSMPPERSRYKLMLKTRDGLAAENIGVAFGTVIKTAAALWQAGWTVKEEPLIVATSYKHAMDVAVEAQRGETQFSVVFQHLPESDRCKLMEEQVLVPERWETKRHVVCEGAPMKLPAPALPEMAERDYEEARIAAEPALLADEATR